MLKKEKSLPVLPTGRIVFCGGKEDKVDWRKLATLDYYLSLILKERKKTPNDCDFSPCIDFNRMFGFDQNISICFPKAETISKRLRFQGTHQPSRVSSEGAHTSATEAKAPRCGQGLSPAKSLCASASDSTARPGNHPAHWEQKDGLSKGCSQNLKNAA